MSASSDHIGDTALETPKCLVVDDDELASRAIQRILESDGFDVEVIGDGESAIARCAEIDPDVIVLDLELPGINGHQTAKQIRETSDAYILMLTGNQGEVDKVLALSTASDDYMTKPFSTAELTARLRALLRRSRKERGTGVEVTNTKQSVEIGALKVDNQARRMTYGDKEMNVTRIEFDIFFELAKDIGACIPRATLIRNVWGFEGAASQHSLDVHVHNLRRKLDEDGVSEVVIEAVRSIGFRLIQKEA